VLTVGTDTVIVAYVQRMINSGTKQIELPGDLVANATKEALDEVRRLCKLCGVKTVVRA
jgi:hypothetical protein